MYDLNHIIRAAAVFTRTTTVISVTSIMLLPLFAHTAKAVSLNQTAIVYDRTIKAGDLFTGLKDEDQKSRILGVAPQPGQEMVINASTLLRVAMAMDLPWRPAYSSEYVTVKRAATVIPASDIEEKVLTYLHAQDAAQNYEIVLDQHVKDIVLPHGIEADFDVESLDINVPSRRFNGILSLKQSDDLAAQTYNISGSLYRLVDVPVLRGSINRGDIISKHDIDIKPMRESFLKGSYIANADDVIGMAPRRNMAAGSIFKVNDIEQPLLVTRGEFVTMVFKNGPLELTARGKALQNGAIGDVVRVENTASNKTIQGTVTEDGNVAIATF